MRLSSCNTTKFQFYRTVMFWSYTSLRHFDGGKFFISQISPKGNWEAFTRRLTRGFSCSIIGVPPFGRFFYAESQADRYRESLPLQLLQSRRQLHCGRSLSSHLPRTVERGLSLCICLAERCRSGSRRDPRQGL